MAQRGVIKGVQPPPRLTGGPLGPIQIVPPGLVGLLQLKQLGRLPDKLADTVAGVIELRDWYLTSRRVDNLALLGGTPIFNAATGVTGNHTFSSAGPLAVVPQNQLWYVEQMMVDCVNTAAMVATDVVRFCGVILPGAGGQQIQVTNDVSDYVQAARTRVIDCKADRGFWMFPGDNLAVRIMDNITTNGWTFALTFRATPCAI